MSSPVLNYDLLDPDRREQEVHIAHPEVVHYTDWNGLNGMISSQTIWATRYDHLNDSTEIVHLRERLVQAVLPHVSIRFKKEVGDSYKRKRAVQKAGGLHIAVRQNAEAIVDAAYKTNFVGRPGATAFSIPFITSFCSHSNDSDYLKENGLLSQWRAYGGTGVERFAIVFDTEKLAASLRSEYERWSYVFMRFIDVVYNDERLEFSMKFSALISAICSAYDSLYDENRGGGINEHTFNTFMSAATRFKHQAFIEEREVRIVAAPTTQELRDYVQVMAGSYDEDNREIKQVQYREKNGIKVPYLSLLERLERELPIRRIIVGPCHDQAVATEKVRKLVGAKFKVVRSKTPFLG